MYACFKKKKHVLWHSQIVSDFFFCYNTILVFVFKMHPENKCSLFILGMHDTGFLPISDMPIFFNSTWPIVDADIFSFVWKQHQVSPVQRS